MRIKSIISTLTLLLVLSFSAQAHGDESKKYSKIRSAVIEKVQNIKTGISDYMSAKVHIHFTVNEDGELIIHTGQMDWNESSPEDMGVKVPMPDSVATAKLARKL